MIRFKYKFGEFGEDDFVYELDCLYEEDYSTKELEELRKKHYENALMEYNDIKLFEKDKYAYFGISENDFHN